MIPSTATSIELARTAMPPAQTVMKAIRAKADTRAGTVPSGVARSGMSLYQWKAAKTLKYKVAMPPPISPWPKAWYFLPSMRIPATSIPTPARIERATRPSGRTHPCSIEYFRKNPMPMTRITTPIRSSHVLAMANSMDTPAGRCSSPTTSQFQIRSRISLAAVSKRLGSRTGRCRAVQRSGVRGMGGSAARPGSLAASLEETAASGATGSQVTTGSTTGGTGGAGATGATGTTGATGGGGAATTSAATIAGFSSGPGGAASASAGAPAIPCRIACSTICRVR